MNSETNLQSQIQVAQVSFVTAASRLLDEAEQVRQQRDELLRLLKKLPKQPTDKGSAAV